MAMSAGQLVRASRQRHGLTQKQLAARRDCANPYDHGNKWTTTVEIAAAVNDAGRYRKRDRSAVTDFQIHGRTKNDTELFERDGTRVRLAQIKQDPQP